jgi:hypothetical protein
MICVVVVCQKTILSLPPKLSEPASDGGGYLPILSHDKEPQINKTKKGEAVFVGR